MILKIKKHLKYLKKQIIQFNYKYRCSVCNNRINKYDQLPEIYEKNSLKYGYKYFGQNEHLNKDNYSCPICNCTDRDRLFAAYFKKYFKYSNSKKSLLHIAPAWELNDLVLKDKFNVITADLMMANVDYHVDIEDMKIFEDDSFDYFICSHVLEHVKDHDKALNELYRILKPGGIGIIMVPIIVSLKDTLEDPNHTSDEERIKYYGQEDHLRLFAKNDFINRIKYANFKIRLLDINDFGKKSFEKLGLKKSSVLYLGVKEQI